MSAIKRLFFGATAGEVASLKGAAAFKAAAAAEPAKASAAAERPRSSCCGLVGPGSAIAEWIGSWRVMLIGEPGDRPWFNVLLVFVPLAIAAKLAHWSDVAQFVLALLAMMPLAERLGFATESLADVRAGREVALWPPRAARRRPGWRVRLPTARGSYM